MKFVYALLLLMLVAVWANPDYSVSDDDGSRSVATVQKPRWKTEVISQNNNDENRNVTQVRKKRGFGSLFKAFVTGLKEFIKNVPRAVSPFAKIAGKLGKSMEYVELGITVVQAVTECPTGNICQLKDELKAIQDDVSNAFTTLNETHTRLEECTVQTKRMNHKTHIIVSHIRHIIQSLGTITDVAELRYLESMNFVCANENETMIEDCLYEKVGAIEFVYSDMEKRINHMKRNNLVYSAISFVAQRAISAIVGNTYSITRKKYDFLVSKFSGPKTKFNKFKLIGKAIFFGQTDRALRTFTSVRNSLVSPVKTLNNKLGRVSIKMRSLGQRVVNKFANRRKVFRRLLNGLNPKNLSVKSVMKGFAAGALTGIASSISIYLKQKQYSELEDSLREFIAKYHGDLTTLEGNIAEGNESVTNCTQYLDFSIGQFRNVTRTVIEVFELSDHMIPNTTESEEIDQTQSEVKTALYRRVSAILREDVDKDNIHLKQNEMLHILENDFFNMTEMKSWVKTENALFHVVKEGVKDANLTVLRMCDKLKYSGLHTAERENWPIQDILCNLALFHPSHKEFDFYNMDNIRDYCRPQPGVFPLETVLLHRKHTFVQETIRRNVESSEYEDSENLSDEISKYLKKDEYMRPLRKFPNEKDVLCNIAEMFPSRFKYAYYDLADFRPRSNCERLTEEKFKQLQLHALTTRNEKHMYEILLSPVIFNAYLNKSIRNGLQGNVPISSIVRDIQRYLNIKRNDNWPIKEVLCVLGSVAPLEMYVYDHYPVDVIRNQCQSGKLLTSQLQDILLKRKENLLELTIRRYVDFEEEDNPEAMVKRIADLLMTDSIMKSMDIIPTEHELICMVADLYPGKEEYGLYRLDQFRPMEACEQITEQGFQILADERERRKWKAMLAKYCADSDEPCFPATRQTSKDEPRAQHHILKSGTWSCHAAKNVFIVLALFASQYIM